MNNQIRDGSKCIIVKENRIQILHSSNCKIALVFLSGNHLRPCPESISIESFKYVKKSVGGA